MIKNTFYLLIALSAMALSACGEKAQMLGTKNDATAYQRCDQCLHRKRLASR